MRSFCIVAINIAAINALMAILCFRQQLKIRIYVFIYNVRDFCPILTTLWFSRQIFIKVPSAKFRQNQSSGSRADSCGQTDGRTDMTKVIVAFREHANSPENKMKKGYKRHLKPLPQYLHIYLSAVTFEHIGKT
jgi:hypothetical protein